MEISVLIKAFKTRFRPTLCPFICVSSRQFSTDGVSEALGQGYLPIQFLLRLLLLPLYLVRSVLVPSIACPLLRRRCLLVINIFDHNPAQYTLINTKNASNEIEV